MAEKYEEAYEEAYEEVVEVEHNADAIDCIEDLHWNNLTRNLNAIHLLMQPPNQNKRGRESNEGGVKCDDVRCNKVRDRERAEYDEVRDREQAERAKYNVAQKEAMINVIRNGIETNLSKEELVNLVRWMHPWMDELLDEYI